MNDYTLVVVAAGIVASFVFAFGFATGYGAHRPPTSNVVPEAPGVWIPPDQPNVHCYRLDVVNDGSADPWQCVYIPSECNGG